MFFFVRMMFFFVLTGILIIFLLLLGDSGDFGDGEEKKSLVVGRLFWVLNVYIFLNNHARV